MKLLETIYVKGEDNLIRPYQRPFEGKFRKTVSQYHAGLLHDKDLQVYFAWYINESLDLSSRKGPLNGFLLKLQVASYFTEILSLRRIARLNAHSQYAIAVPKRLDNGSKNQGYRKLLKTAREIQNLLGNNDEEDSAQ